MTGDIPLTICSAVSAGHEQAAEISWQILNVGGNATDAGVAAVLALTVLHSEQVQLGGIAPMLIRPPNSKVTAIDGVGRWPTATDPEHFLKACKGRIPRGILRTVTPALPDACITALARFGTMGFAQIAEPAERLAREGFTAHADLAAATKQFERQYRALPDNAAIWLPNDRPVEVGEKFVQPALARTFRRLILAESEAGPGADRVAGLTAVRQEFYEGGLATEMAAHVRHNGGWLAAEDLQCHRSHVGISAAGKVFDGTLHTNGLPSQGPSLIQALQIFEVLNDENNTDIGPQFWDNLFQSIELAMADRDRFYGDPKFGETRLSELLDPHHAAQMAQTARRAQAGIDVASDPDDVSVDTSVVAVVDRDGGVFVATPSDQSHDAPAVPGLGFVMSTRGGQSYTDPAHPACVLPAKKPRASACPFILETADGRIIAGGGPGADLLIQSAVQVLARHLGARRSLKDAIKLPRAMTLTPPGSSEPHLAFPGKVTAEDLLPEAEFSGLLKLGYKAVRGGARSINQASLCLVETNLQTGHSDALGDPRRESGQRVGVI